MTGVSISNFMVEFYPFDRMMHLGGSMNEKRRWLLVHRLVRNYFCRMCIIP